MRTSPNRLLGAIVGAVYLLVGIAGFAVTGGRGFFSAEGGRLLGVFEVNAFQNIVHILIGAALLIAGLSRARAARTVNSTVGAVCLVLGFAGLFLVGSSLNVLAVNVNDSVLHFGTSAVLLAVGLGARERDAA